MPEQNTLTNDSSQGARPGSLIPFDSIDSPGAYVLEDSGLLVRVPADAIAPGRSPKMTICSNKPLRVFKISDDPFVTKTKAAQLAADHDIQQNWM